MEDLRFGVNLGLTLYSMLLLGLLIAAECRQMAVGIDRPRRQKIFLFFLCQTLVTLGADLLSRFDGAPIWRCSC